VPILEGARQTLKEANAVIIETYNFQIAKDSLRFWEMCSYMENLGFLPIDMADFMHRKKDGAFWQMDTFLSERIDLNFPITTMIDKYPKISIVTPSYNQSLYLEQTILSVLEQNYPNLEYVIIDGGSSDDSVKIIRRYEKYLAYWVSESDKGMYHAMQKASREPPARLWDG